MSKANAGRVIRIEPMGNVGNQMFQYIFARTLQTKVPSSIVTGYDMPMWGLKAPPCPEMRDPMVIRGGHVFDVGGIVAHLNARDDAHLDYGGYGQRLEYHPSPDFAAALFAPDIAPSAPAFGNDHIVINVRGGEIMAGIHRDYVPVPPAFYRKLVASIGKTPVFMGQIDFRHRYSQALRQIFPNAIFLQSRGAADDFEIMRRAAHVVPSVSTFAWLATWMSRAAQTIHLPVLGIFNPAQRSDIDLAPRTDARYRFHEFPVMPWTGSEPDWRFVLEPG